MFRNITQLIYASLHRIHSTLTFRRTRFGSMAHNVDFHAIRSRFLAENIGLYRGKSILAFGY